MDRPVVATVHAQLTRMMSCKIDNDPVRQKNLNQSVGNELDPVLKCFRVNAGGSEVAIPTRVRRTLVCSRRAGVETAALWCHHWQC